jgi:hypothetical protein
VGQPRAAPRPREREFIVFISLSRLLHTFSAADLQRNARKGRTSVDLVWHMKPQGIDALMVTADTDGKEVLSGGKKEDSEVAARRIQIRVTGRMERGDSLPSG